LGVIYKGKDNNDFINGGSFCCLDNSALRSGNIGKGNDNPELYQYYYHSDHLGSTSLITNLDGEIVQHVEYVPFGEVFIEERNNTWNTPYLFNAKELDEETGLYYYVARYYDPRTNTWLSADPLQEKYPGISTYAYCNNNPVKYVDPNGMDYYTKSGEDGQGEKKWQDSNKKWFVDENGNTWEYHSAGEKEAAVVIPGKDTSKESSNNSPQTAGKNNQAQGTDNVKNDTENNNYQKEIEAYRKNQPWEQRFGRWLREKGVEEFDKKATESIRPVIQGAILLVPTVGIVNDGFVLFGERDIYENKATSLDKGAAAVDLVTLGTSKWLKLPSSVRKVSSTTNKITTLYSAGSTMYNEYTK
jgi:RHS repeat-associated protein